MLRRISPALALVLLTCGHAMAGNLPAGFWRFGTLEIRGQQNEHTLCHPGLNESSVGTGFALSDVRFAGDGDNSGTISFDRILAEYSNLTTDEFSVAWFAGSARLTATSATTGRFDYFIKGLGGTSASSDVVRYPSNFRYDRFKATVNDDGTMAIRFRLKMNTFDSCTILFSGVLSR